MRYIVSTSLPHVKRLHIFFRGGKKKKRKRCIKTNISTIFSPRESLLATSDQNLISVLRPPYSLDPSMKRCYWYHASVRWKEFKKYIPDFPWHDYCYRVGDPFVCAKDIVDGIEMEAHIPRKVLGHYVFKMFRTPLHSSFM